MTKVRFFMMAFILLFAFFGCRTHQSSTPSSTLDETARNVEFPGDTVEVAMEFSPERSPFGSRAKRGFPYEFFGRVPRMVSTPPPGKSIYYGELEFFGSVQYLFAISLSAVGEERPRFYLDMNRNGDFTDDTPESYEGMGTNRTAVNFSLQIPRPDGKDESYTLWLYTSLEADAKAVSNLVDPAYNYYGTFHKTGSLRLETSNGEEDIMVSAVDSLEYDGLYAVDRIFVDWNGNNQVEDADVFTVGDTLFYRGVHVTLISVEKYADAIIFGVESAESPGRNVLDVEADLSLEPIVGNVPPPIGVKDLNGEMVDLDDYAGSVLLIDFWAAWCPPCSEELPNLLDTYDRYHEQGFEIIGVSLDEDLSALASFLEENEITWRQICDGKGWKGKIPTRYRVSGIPMPILVGRDGKIVSLNARGNSLSFLVADEIAKKQ